jgi:hypothetical protein
VSELNEVNNKLGALKKALEIAKSFEPPQKFKEGLL